jgi:DNA-binding NarL/FixJ family response regulator
MGSTAFVEVLNRAGDAAAPAAGTARLRVLAVDGRPLLRAGLANLARQALGCRAQPVADLAQAATMVRMMGAAPHAVLLGVRSEDDLGPVLREARRLGAPVILALETGEPGMIAAALAADADGYLPIDGADAEMVRQVILSSRDGEAVVPEAIERHRLRTRAGDVTARALEVLRCLATGMQDDEIAAELGISTSSVRKHLATSQERLQARTRTQLVAIAARRGLV